MSTALVTTGITGQDSSYLAEFLLSKGYTVIGLSRRTSTVNFEPIAHIQEQITITQDDLHDQSSQVNILEEFQPTELYNLSSQLPGNRLYLWPKLQQWACLGFWISYAK
jgi:GDPmannose 4,6-dehydratase